MHDFSIERIRDSHIVENFDCGNPDLNEFLMKFASYEQGLRLNQTFLCKGAQNSDVMGYFTILNDSVKLKEMPEYNFSEIFGSLSIKYKELPALKLGRLGVHKGSWRKGIGRYLVNICVGIARKMPCRLLVADVMPESESFYKKCGFERLTKTNQGDTVPMFVDLLSYSPE